MDVSDVLRDRMQEPDGLPRMAAISALAHAGVAALLILAPAGWVTPTAETPRTVMTISLDGGTGGPRSGGLSSMGQRPVQAETPPEAPKRPEPVRPPAAKAAPMTVPERNAPRRRAAADVQQAPQDARGTTPTRGAEVTRGAAVADTGVRGQGFGLSTGGQPGFGSFLDVSDFCCPEYIALMLERIRSNWNQGAGRIGQSMVRFTIQREGRIGDVILEESSGNAVADQNAQRAVLATSQLPPLPAAFPNPTLTVHLSFRYTR